MNTKQLKGWLKHGDFILLDILCLQVCFILSFWLIRGYGNPYGMSSYQYQAIILIVSQFAVILFTNNYSGILRRKRFDELVAVIRYIVWILVIAFFYLFLVKDSAEVSRLQFGFTAVFFIRLGYCFRQLN